MPSTLVHSWQEPDFRCRLGVLAKRSYHLGPGRAAAMAEPAAVEHEPRIAGTDGEEEMLLPADSEAFRRPLTDVVLLGQAHALRGATRELLTGVQIGRARKVVRVTGNRTLRVAAGGALSAGAADHFVTMPLSWHRAYGGRDRYAEEVLARAPDASLEVKLGSFSYPRNPIGRGFVADLDPERLDGMVLPNLDDPDDPLTAARLLARDALDWADRPVAASYGALHPLMFPRSMFSLLRPDWNGDAQAFRELALGAVLERDLADQPLDRLPLPRFFNCAPAGLAVCRLQGGERASLWNLHRQHELLEIDLPSDRPLLMVEPPGCRAFELQPALAMVLLEPDADRLTLTWTGAMDVAAMFPEAMCKEMRHAASFSR